MLDVGTNNEELLSSKDYVGTPERRLDGDEYYDFVDEFMQAVVARWPDCVIQFEDFETPKVGSRPNGRLTQTANNDTG